MDNTFPAMNNEVTSEIFFTEAEILMESFS
jgi:hypothetical protein